MSEIHRVPQHRVRADGRVRVEHHADGSRTVFDENGLPDRYIPASVTWEQWEPQTRRVRLRALAAGFVLGCAACAGVALIAAATVRWWHP